MPHINFLEKKELIFSYLIMLIVTVSVMLVYLVLYGALQSKLGRVNNEAGALRDEIKQLEQLTDTQAVDQKGEIRTSSYIDKIQSQVIWTRILQVMSSEAFQKVWMTQVTATTFPKPKLELKGNAFSTTAISAFVTNLLAKPTFSNVIMKTGEEKDEKQVAKKLYQNFSIDCEVNP